MIPRFSLALATLLLLAACNGVSGPLPHETAARVHPQTIQAQQRWWEAFHDPLMDRFADQLLAQNLDIQIAHARVAEARGIARIASSGFFPDIAATGSASRGNDQFGLVKPASIAKGGFDAQWEIDLFGQTRAQASAAEARVNARIASVEDVTNALLAELFRTVVEWRQANQTLKETNALLATENEQVQLFSSQAKAGLIDTTFSERAAAQRAQTATQIPLALAARDAAEYKMERLLGKSPGELSALLAENAGELTVPESKEITAITLDVMRQRPDIRVAKAEMLAAQSDLAKAEADLWPRVGIGAFFGVQEGSDGIRLASNPIWSLAASVTAPILNFGRLHGAVDVADARAKQASLAYENTVLTALQETKTALSDYLNGINAINEQATALAYRQDTVRLAEQRFTRGLTDMTDLTTAQAELDQATLLLIQRKAEAAIAYIRLQKALGIVTKTS